LPADAERLLTTGGDEFGVGTLQISAGRYSIFTARSYQVLQPDIFA
jgi:hypothetical protein